MLQVLTSCIDRLNDWVGRTAAWLALVMVLLMATIVVLRYGFQFGSIAMQELVVYLNALIFTLGAAYTLKEQGHVRVDIFYNRLSDKGRAVIDLLGGVLLLMPACLFIFFSSWDYVALSWRIREGSIEASGLQYVYLLKTTILVLAALLGLQGLAEIARTIARLRRGDLVSDP